MKNFTTLTLILFLLVPGLKAQIFMSDPFPTQNSYGRFHLTMDDIDGSPYLDYNFKKGTVITPDGALYKEIPMRYNCYGDVLEFQKDGVSYDIIPKDRVSRAEFGGQIFCYLPYESEKGAKAYFHVLADGKARLCVRYIISFYDKEPLKGFAESKPARFADLVETYWVSTDESPVKKVLSAKKLVEILSDKKSQVEAFISKQKISVKKIEDLKKVINYYNTL